MYEAISDADLVHVVGGCVCGPQQQPTDPNAGGTNGAGAPTTGPTQPAGAPAPGTGGQPSGGCDQLLQAITQLLNLFGGMNGAAPGATPQQKPATQTA